MACKTPNKKQTAAIPSEVRAILPLKSDIMTVLNNKVKEPEIFHINHKETKLPETTLIINEKAISIGKSLVFLDETSFGPTKKERELGFEYSSKPEMDDFRMALGKYWTIENNTEITQKYPQLVYLNEESKSGIKIFDYNVTGLGMIKLKDYHDGAKQNWGTFQVVLLSKQSYSKEEKWNKFVDQIVKRRTDFEDISSEIEIPFSREEKENIEILNDPLEADVESMYNFYIKEYEKKSTSLPEIILPNFYAVLSDFTESEDDDIRILSSVNGSVDVNLIPKSISAKKDLNSKTLLKHSGQYFDAYVKALQWLEFTKNDPGNVKAYKKQSMQRLMKASKRYENIGFPYESMDLLSQTRGRKYLFPMYSDVSFDTDKTTVVAEILKDSKLSSNLMSSVMRDIRLDSGFEKKNLLEVQKIMEQVKHSNGGSSLSVRYSFEKNERKEWDISDWIQKFDTSSEDEQKQIIKEFNDEIGIFVGNIKTNDVMSATNYQFKMFRNLLKIIFEGKLRKLVKDRFRTYEEMMNGKKAYSETVMYRVEKLKLSDNGSGVLTESFVQNFYFPNSNEIDTLNFVDSQVKYGGKYRYRIYAYQIVIGTRYNYSLFSTLGDFAAFLVKQFPLIKMVEIPYFEIDRSILDDPPVVPDVQLITYQKEKDKVLMFFNGNVDDYLATPISILPEDKEKIDNLRKLKGYGAKEKIRYRADDGAKIFQIFRTDRKPMSYEDFSSNLLMAAQTDVDGKTPQSATAASYLDTIRPNKKYWYCFRAFDIHDHFSNPTSVYQVEIIEQQGMIYPKIEVFAFEKEKKQDPSKVGRKYILIRPTFLQDMINEQKSGLIGRTTAEGIQNVTLGVQDEGVWNKKFKIRLVSKKTGKILDLNVDFLNNFKKIEEDWDN